MKATEFIKKLKYIVTLPTTYYSVAGRRGQNGMESHGTLIVLY